MCIFASSWKPCVRYDWCQCDNETAEKGFQLPRKSPYFIHSNYRIILIKPKPDNETNQAKFIYNRERTQLLLALCPRHPACSFCGDLHTAYSMCWTSIFKTRCTLAKPSRAMCRLWCMAAIFWWLCRRNIIRRWGYRAGVISGLMLYGIGALLFIPGGRLLSFPFFLFSLFIIGLRTNLPWNGS